jgi:hypothetical protein
MTIIRRPPDGIVYVFRAPGNMFAGIMKLIAASILILLIATQTFSKWFVVLSFHMNREYITKNICENRYKPELKCKGNCVLMKRMKQEEKQEQDTPPAVKIEMSSMVLSARSFFATAVPPVFRSNTPYVKAGDSGKPIDRAFSIFHPPAA